MKWTWLLLLAGCQLAPINPQDDAGPPPDAGPGTGTLQGPMAFDVHGAFELHNVTSDGQTLGYSFVMVEHDLTCAEQQALDGGPIPVPFREVYAGVLSNTPNSGPPTGTFQVLESFPSGGGYAAFVSWTEFYGDGGSAGPFVATDGSVTLSISGPYEVSGTFSATLPDANGQATGLTGLFDAPYCP